MSIEAMKQARYALEMGLVETYHARQRDAIIALSTAITEAEKPEPVACRHEWFSTGAMEPNVCRCIHCGKWGNTTPPAAYPEFECPRCGHCCAQRQPLTIAELRKCFLATNKTDPLAEGWPGLERFARAIEAAHGIGGEA